MTNATEARTGTDGAQADGAKRTVHRILQRVVLPADRDIDVLPLYVDRDKAQLEPEALPGGKDYEVSRALLLQPTSSGESLHPDAILDRRRLRVDAGDRVSFGTYFNGFPASYWRLWTVVTQVTLTVQLSGVGANVIVYRSMANGRSQRVDSASVDGDAPQTFTFDLPLKPFGDGGWYWFDVVAADDPAVLEGAVWSAEVPADRAGTGTVTVGITTMNRPDFCSKLLAQLGEDEGLAEVLDEVLVVEQGTDKVADSPLFPKAEAALGGRLRVIEQANMGGSGGYARAQLETVRGGRSTYVLCMDDDVVAEPESIIRAATFGDLCRKPTIVGGHMFSLYSRSRLHSFGEIINKWRFWWQSPNTVINDWDFAARNLRSARWLHRRIDVDYNGWFMCLIPVEVMREIGLSLPLFIKWDDSEYGVRAQSHGIPTVTLPGAAVWHVPWTDKNDALDWQAYFHQRNRTIAALLHSPYDHGGRLVRESFNHQVKHLLAMQYSTAELRHRALEDVLAGPERLHDDLRTKLPEIRALRQQFEDARTVADPDAFPPVKREKPPRRGKEPTQPKGQLGQIITAGLSAVRQFRPPRPLSKRHPEARLAAMDARWWMLSQFDSAVVSTPDGTMSSWHHRDPARFADMMKRTVEIHQRLLREWPTLSRRYKDALPEITSEQRWEKTFEGNAPEAPSR
jgi:galactofuranosylgalactofuranosylrhamnosyl-N-acetylglucosaminyl-diphospho-decaprenol beta-1,5/1,6-galactofuranosyltransferase